MREGGFFFLILTIKNVLTLSYRRLVYQLSVVERWKVFLLLLRLTRVETTNFLICNPSRFLGNNLGLYTVYYNY
jgi:hypothetical protein